MANSYANPVKEDIRRFCYEGAKCTESMFQVNEHVSLRVLSFTPLNKGNSPIVLVGGLTTATENFQDIFCELSKDFPIYYIETREKASSEITGNVQFNIETLGLDVVSLIRMLGLVENKYVLVGYSMGATIVADAYRFLESKPSCMVFIEPTPVFHYPKWSIRLIRRFGISFYSVLKPVGKWYLDNLIINKKEDNEMAVISSKSLDQADPQKLRSTILAIAGYVVWDRLGSILCPVLIIATSKDQMHIHDEIIRMVSALKNSSYIDLETNKRTHSAEMAHVIRKYVNETFQ